MDVSHYLEIFIDEINGYLQDLSDCIMRLENEPGNKDTINEIFRVAHSMKGMAGTMGFKRMQHLTHDMENVFQEIRSNKMKVTSELIDILFQCLDAIDSYLENIKASSDEGKDDNEAIIAELNRILTVAGNPLPVMEKKAVPVKEGDRKNIKKYEKIILNDAERDVILTAQEKGMKVYGFTAYISEDCLLKAARVFLVFKAVEEYGEILVYNPSINDIEDEKFETDFSFFLSTDMRLEKIIESAQEVSEITDVVAGLYEVKSQDEMSVRTAAVEVKMPQLETVSQTGQLKPAGKTPQEKPAASANKSKGGRRVTSRTIRVDIEKLDALMNQVSELIIAKNSIISISTSEESNFESQGFREQIKYLERITTGLHESVMKVRMVPIETVVSKFPRMIRDLSKKLGKKMELVMTGEKTELDRTVVDQIGDPLQHLLRNSADHGLESAEIRAQRGKPEVGTIFLKAFQEGNNVIIEVGDDGNGIDTEKVKNKAVERGLFTPEQAENLTQKEIIDLLFMPSFSMAKQITDISGRGVGLDVVKAGIEALGGDVEVKSTLRAGTKFTVRLPLTLAIIKALMVEVRDEKYAIALGSIQSIEEINVNEIKYVQTKEVIQMRGVVLPLIRLDKLLDAEPLEKESESMTVVVIRKGDKQAGIVVDNLIGQQEIVIKSLGKYINGNKLISGATILGDGEVALILDVNTLM